MTNLLTALTWLVTIVIGVPLAIMTLAGIVAFAYVIICDLYEK